MIRVSKASVDTAVFEAMMVDAAPAPFTPVNAVARWLSSVNAGLITDSNFYINLMSSNLGQQENQSLSGTITYRLPSGASSATCPSGVVCTVRVQRTWTLLRATNRTNFVLEKLEFPGPNGFSQTRINRYDGS